jgi:glycosyltransferase involved in cell wall biosynthesis
VNTVRIAVLEHNLVVAGGLSVGKNMTALLPKIAPRHTYLMLVPKGLGYDRHEKLDNVKVLEIARMSFIKRGLFEMLRLPKLVNDFRPDVVLCLGNIGMRNPPCKQVILFHQSQSVYPSRHYGKTTLSELCKMWQIKRWVKKSLKHTNLVFCQTPVVRERFSNTFQYPLDRIKIMPNAVSEFAKIDKQHVEVPEALKGERCFNLLYLTKFYSHKNPEILIDVFKNNKEELKGVRCITTVAPEQHPSASRFLKNVRKFGLEEHIVNVGPIRQEKLSDYFYNCDGLLFPTLLESFSGTYLEAMHFGLPILTSDLDFAHYICGEAALYFDPWNPRDIAEKILLLKNNPDIRSRLAETGKSRITTFYKSWYEIVPNVIEEIERLI